MNYKQSNEYGVVQVLFSGLGGHFAVASSIAKETVFDTDTDTERSSSSVNHTLVFYGTAELVAEYKKACASLNVDYKFHKKKTFTDFRGQWSIFNSLKGKPCKVVILHQPQVLPVARFYFLLQKILGNPVANLIVVEHHPNNLKTKSKWLLSALNFVFADDVVFLTDAYRAEVRNKLGPLFRKFKARLIPNGIDCDVYAPLDQRNSKHLTTSSAAARLELREKPIIFGMASRLSDQKDIFTLLRSFKELYADYPGVKLKIAGDGPQKTELVNWCLDNSLEDAIIFSGMLDETDLVSFYRSLDVYVHATKSETMSTSVMQAAACGLPVLASDITGMKEMLDESFMRLSEPGDVTMLNRHMIELFGNRELRLTMGESARQHALNRFSHKMMFKSYLDLVS